MAKESFDKRLEQAVERLYEDEGLRSNLDDASAKLLLSWGARQAKAAGARAAVELDEEVSIRSLMAPIREAIRDINGLVGERASLADEAVQAQVAALVAKYAGPSASKGAAIREVSAQQGSLNDRDFVARVLSLLDGASHDDAPRAASRPAAPPPASPRRAKLSGSSSASSGRTLLATAGGLLAALVLAVCLIGSGWFLLRGNEELAPEAPPPAAPPVASDAPYAAFFTTPQYPDDPAARRPSPLAQALADLIGSAARTVDVAAYQLDHPAIVGALLGAVERGVRVRVVTDIDILLDEDESAPFLELEAAGVVVVGGNSNAIMHNKFVVVDAASVWTGSWNLTENDTYRYNNNGILLRSPDLARNYIVAFEKMWADQLFGPNRDPGGTRPRLNVGGVAVENYFSPEDGVAAQIVSRLAAAEQTIDFMAFSFTADDIGAVVTEAAEAGVAVRGVFENTGSDTQYSEYGAMRAMGLDVYQDGNPYLMHHKVFIVDRRTVILGSYNFSQNAETSNDENVLIIDDAALAQQFLGQFENVYNQARNAP